MMGSCSIYLAIKEIQLKTTWRLHLTSVKIAISLKKKVNADENVRKREEV
jgi:hypothetical protein